VDDFGVSDALDELAGDLLTAMPILLLPLPVDSLLDMSSRSSCKTVTPRLSK